jgi:hypothetical protein
MKSGCGGWDKTVSLLQFLILVAESTIFGKYVKIRRREIDSVLEILQNKIKFSNVSTVLLNLSWQSGLFIPAS